MRAVLGGDDAVKEAGDEFLPMLTEQSPEEYEAYKDRAQFFNATARTRDGFSGLIFRKDPKVEIPAEIEYFKKDTDLFGVSFDQFTKQIADEVIGVGRVGTLIDWNSTEGRAYVSTYQAEQIINWRVARINGRNVLALLCLKENVNADGEIPGADLKAKAPAGGKPEMNHRDATGPGPQPAEQIASPQGAAAAAVSTGDEFSPEMVEQIRVYRLTQTKETETVKVAGVEKLVNVMAVVCEIYRKIHDGKGFELIATLPLMRKGKALTEIPFVFHGPRNSKPDVDRPPLEDVATVNLSHFRNSADYEHGLHFTGLPTAWVAGFKKDTVLKIGSSTAWVSESPEAKAGFLEFTGQGLDALKDAMERKEHQMAILGARMLEAAKREAETAEAMQIKAGGEGSVVTNIAKSVSASLTLVVKWVVWWHQTADKKLSDISDEVIVALNLDFSALQLEAAEILALVKAWQARAISRSTLDHVLQRGEIIPASRQPGDEAELIETETPPPAPLPDKAEQTKPTVKK
jgi:hypothetical protein